MGRFVRDIVVFCVTVFGVGFVLLTTQEAPLLAFLWVALAVFLVARQQRRRSGQAEGWKPSPPTRDRTSGDMNWPGAPPPWGSITPNQ
jgi:hypothetical protein